MNMSYSQCILRFTKVSATDKFKVDPNILISDLTAAYPQVGEYLQLEYGFHCVGCFASEFDTLVEGAQLHGIIGADFAHMLSEVERIISEIEEK